MPPVLPDDDTRNGLRRTLAAFGYRDFRVLWFGACTSSVGTWMQSLAANWLVLALTGSATYLGLDAFLQQLPIMLFTLIGGVLADRLDRRRTLLTSQYIQTATATTLAILVFFGWIQIWHILLLSFITGCAQAFGGPAYQSLIPSLVDKRDLTNAIALNSIQFNVARVIGPLIAGAVLSVFAVWGFGESSPVAMAACFTINALSYLVVIYSLMSLHVRHIPPPTRRSMLEELRGGLSYVRRTSVLPPLIVLAFATTFLGMPVLTLLPVFARDIYQEGVAEYSRMMAFSGAGAIVGSLTVAWLGRMKHMGVKTLCVQAAFGVFIILFAVTRVLYVSYFLLFLTNVALMIVFSTVTSLIQLTAPNEMRGRVMSIYLVAFRGGMPLGSLASGYLASTFSAPAVLVVNGTLLSLVALYFLFWSRVREI
ncbi:MAG: MFS transporter [Vicinamibacterales bacterium]